MKCGKFRKAVLSHREAKLAFSFPEQKFFLLLKFNCHVFKQNEMNMSYGVIRRSECHVFLHLQTCGISVTFLTKYELTIDKVS